MITFVMRPKKAPIVKGNRLYTVDMNGVMLFDIRAKNAADAEEKIKFLMERETKGKTIDFNLEDFKKKI